MRELGAYDLTIETLFRLVEYGIGTKLQRLCLKRYSQNSAGLCNSTMQAFGLFFKELSELTFLDFRREDPVEDDLTDDGIQSLMVCVCMSPVHQLLQVLILGCISCSVGTKTFYTAPCAAI